MFPKSTSFVIIGVLSTAYCQQAGTVVPETHPSLSWSRCNSTGCQSVVASIVLDANWRWIHNVAGYTNCYAGNTWNTTLCPEGTICASNCALDGADYQATYGISTSGNSITLKFNGNMRQNLGSRVYLLNTETRYEIFQLLNKELTFDVDASNLPCGFNGALYFTSMDADGGMAKYPGNKAGAKYGTGYCDSKCPRNLKFINGEANVQGWTPSPQDPNSGTGYYGSCCNEMDIWEANSISAVYTLHPCTVQGPSRCSGTACGINDRYGTTCDPDGCDFNSFRMGDPYFYGPGGTSINSQHKITVVTQFLTNNNSSTGTISEIRRLYIQNGHVIQNSKVNIPEMNNTLDSITGAFCDAQKTAFGDPRSFQDKGGMEAMGRALGGGMVLTMSIWKDPERDMLWLDSSYPLDADPSKPGVRRGTCGPNTGPTIPEDPDDQRVTFSNIRFGDIGTTYTAA
ncbi:hypothetical protein AX16_004528 [Volvariella volvacea WC 439]|nr:hypothetical protein AX16_004528 [Volvariella volvacea WC 439]